MVEARSARPASPIAPPQPFDPEGAWRSHYRSANAPVSLIERFAAFRALHPQESVERDGLIWRHRASGAGEAVLLLPGRHGASDFSWRLIELLERSFRVIALDYPAADSAEALVRGIAAVLEAEGLSAATLIASGFGGMAAQRFIDRQPNAVTALALLNAPAPARRLAARALARSRLLQGLPQRWARRLERGRFEKRLTSPPDERHFWDGYVEEAFAQPWPLATAIALSKAEADLHLIGGDSPSGFRRPVLIVETEGDRSAPQDSLRRLPARFPQAERLCFSYGAGHTVEITRAREIAHAVRQLQTRV